MAITLSAESSLQDDVRALIAELNACCCSPRNFASAKYGRRPRVRNGAVALGSRALRACAGDGRDERK